MFNFIQHIHDLFGFEYDLEVSRRPGNYLRQIETWNEAEVVCPLRLFARAFSYVERLTTCVLLSFFPATDEGAGQVLPQQVGAEPGRRRVLHPKIDIKIKDALSRSFQCAMIQLDFQFPEHLNLKCHGADEAAAADAGRPPPRPVMIHHTILGQYRAFHCDHHKALRGQVAVLAVVAPGACRARRGSLCEYLYSFLFLLRSGQR